MQVFVAGKYETDQPASWAEGDWNADKVFDTSDFVIAFTDGGYEQGLLPDAAAVPEPSTALLLILGILCAVGRKPTAGNAT